MVLWEYPLLIYSQTDNQKSNSEIYQLEFIQQVVWRWFKRWKKSVCWVVSSHKKGTLLTSFHIHSFVAYWFAEEHNCDMHPYVTESHYVKYAGSITSAYAIATILSCVIVFHRHHQSLYWRRILPRSNLYPWL